MDIDLYLKDENHNIVLYGLSTSITFASRNIIEKYWDTFLFIMKKKT